jgi:hypothetical protein
MKKKRRVISRKELPVKLPIFSTFMAWFFMDKYHAPGWIWGVVGTVMAILWFGAILVFVDEVDVSVVPKEEK